MTGGKDPIFNQNQGVINMNSALQEMAGNEPSEEKTSDVGGIAGQRLKSFIERVERLEEEKAALAEDIKEVLAECKATGFEVKIVRKIVKLRRMDSQARHEEDELTELYKAAIGLV